MFSNALIAFIGAIGVSGWIYSKIQRQTGNNTKSSLTVATAVGGLVFLVLIVLLSMFT